MRTLIAALITILALLAPVASTAQPSDRCSDVLNGGVFNYARLRDNNYFNQVVWSRFFRSSDSSSQSDSSLGISVPIGDVVVGGTFDSSSDSRIRSRQDYQYFNEITASREIDVALMTADPAILSAWSSCMRNRGGLSARFEAVSATDVFLVIEFYNQATITSFTLDEDVYLPDGVTAVQNGRCLRAGYVFRVGEPCTVLIKTTDGMVRFPVVIGSATAWLPARIRLVREALPFPLPERILDLQGGNSGNNGWHSQSFSLSDQQIADGWSFSPSGGTFNLSSTSIDNPDTRCHSASVSAAGHTVTYTYYMHTPDRTRNDGRALCHITANIEIVRARWISQ